MYTFVLVMFASACSIKAVPTYDQKFYDNLTAINTQMMTMFASIAQGTDQESFSDREDPFNSLIGSLDALIVQSKARPVADNGSLKETNKYLQAKGMGPIEDGTQPTASQLALVVEHLTQMKQTDGTGGLSPAEIEIHKTAILSAMEKALTYESLLNR